MSEKMQVRLSRDGVLVCCACGGTIYWSETGRLISCPRPICKFHGIWFQAPTFDLLSSSDHLDLGGQRRVKCPGCDSNLRLVEDEVVGPMIVHDEMPLCDWFASHQRVIKESSNRIICRGRKL